LRATRVDITLAPTTAPRMRRVFRAIKFRRLMVRVCGDAHAGYHLALDGPMSLFEATQRYGVQLAMFLPVLVAGDGWQLRASVRWGRDREQTVFELSDTDGLISHLEDHATELEEIDGLVRAFGRVGGGWRVRREARVFELKGQGVFVPDLVFSHNETGARVYLEAFGYWSREAVFDRVAMLDKAFPDRFILAVSRKLRVSADIADDNFPGAILVYTGAISASAVKRLLEEIGSTAAKTDGG
ncbi:MAG: DUF790 family protein, partial [Polyangiaceae bacterium]|nr:DUF790 family protein [Polyangiaceae bacterium]